MAKVGDIVRYLNAVGGGTIVRIKDNMAFVDDDGFETPVLLRECVVVGTSAAPATQTAHPAPKDSTAPKVSVTAPATTETEPEEELPEEETPGGDILNITLGFEALDLTHISEGGYEAYLINDSNYYLYFTLLHRKEDESNWSTFYAGIVEPNIQLLLGVLDSTQAAGLDHLMVQAVAFKRNKSFTAQHPVSVGIDVDTTKFYKPHCFTDNTYFENKVLAFNIVRDGRQCVSRKLSDNEARTLADAMMAKKIADRPQRRPIKKHRPKANEPLVVDLHIHELVDTTRGLSNADMLNLQVDHFRKIMDQNLRNHGKKIIFIHGKGEGVLRHALQKELTHRYKGHDVCDASFREYGYGATQVTIR